MPLLEAALKAIRIPRDKLDELIANLLLFTPTLSIGFKLLDEFVPVHAPLQPGTM
jgi:hypothetical protein|tara:strand:- start:88 stop:252 length:165 start_codon:yes stop_codon:yes gene_type:complete